MTELAAIDLTTLFTFNSLHHWLLVLAIISLWIPKPHQLWLTLFVLSVITGLGNGEISIPGCLAIILLGFACFLMGQLRQDSTPSGLCASWSATRQRNVRIIAHIAFLSVSAALVSNMLPGFDSLRIIDKVSFHQNSPATGISLHYNIALIGLFYFAFCVDKLNRRIDWWHMLKQTLPVAMITTGIIMSLGVILGLLAFDPVMTWLFLPFLVSNMLITTLAEEAVFRGWLQGGLEKLFSRQKFGVYMALGLAALIFGIAHLKGGPWLILAATLAGLGYGYARVRSGRLEASVITHFFLNGFHFVFMTYPFLNQS